MIAVDTQVLIWEIKEQSTPNRKEMVPRAKQLLDSLAQQNTQIMVPALVLSEFLVRYTVDERVKIIAEMQRRFFVAPFDVRATSLSAQMFAETAAWKEARAESDSTKQCIKVDISILASAEAARPSVFYVEDVPLRTLAERMKAKGIVRLSVQPLPPLADRQTEMFKAPPDA